MHEPPRILVVDDEEVNLLVLKGILEAQGFAAITARNGVEARQKAKELSPDLILLDVMMPGETGFSVCAGLKAEPSTVDTPVVFVTALADLESKMRGFELGAVDYVVKPFEREEVLARVRIHIKMARALKTLVEEQALKLKALTEAQQAFLVRPEDAPGAGFAVEYRARFEAGGDFYDVVQIAAKSVGAFIADICGHDLGASFVTSSLKALFRQNFGPLYTPVETMRGINAVLHSILPEAKYLTAQLVTLHRGMGRLEVVNAGHPYPILLPKNGQARLIEAEGDVLGAFESVVMQPTTVSVNRGDRVFLYTDGLFERFDEAGSSRSAALADLMALIGEAAPMSKEAAVTWVAERMLDKYGPPGDDLVLLCLEV